METRAVVNPETGGCVPEDTYAPLALTAVPGTGDVVTQITLTNVPNNWDVGWSVRDSSVAARSSARRLRSGHALDHLQRRRRCAGVRTVTITAQIKGAPDFDVNGTGLTVGATVVDGVVFAKDTTDFNVIVDAVADGDDKGDDGDADKLGVTIEVTDGSADVNTTFQVGETGNVNVRPPSTTSRTGRRPTP